MGKIGSRVLRNCFLVLWISIFILLVSGCGTINGAVKGALAGARADWEAAKKTDQWMRENLW